MVKAKMGSKRTCTSCDAKFYDLNKEPAVCPKCGEKVEKVTKLKPRRSAPPPDKKPAPKVVAAPKVEAEPAAEEKAKDATEEEELLEAEEGDDDLLETDDDDDDDDDDDLSEAKEHIDDEVTDKGD